MTKGPDTHIHISEREADGTFEDCTWDSGLEFYRDAFDPSVPATHAEAQRLRADSGEPPTGGSNLTDLRNGVRKRYKSALPPAINARDILKALVPGTCAVVQGSMSAFGPGHRLSKFDRNFNGGHAVYLANFEGDLLWCDPEAPKDAAVPVVVTKDEVRAFVNAFPGEAIVAPIKTATKPPKEDDVDLKTYLPGYTAKVKKGSNIRLAPRIAAEAAHKAIPAAMTVNIVGTVVGDKDPGNKDSTVWYAFWHESRTEYTAEDNIVGLTPPTEANADCSAQDAEVARLSQEVNSLMAQNAALVSEGNATAKRLNQTLANIDALKG